MHLAESETDSKREAETQSKPRREPSPAQIAANRANSKLSTGPRSDQGKAVSRLNGVTHGMTCHLPVVLPGEDPEQFLGEVDRWARQLGAETEAERAQVETAVSTRWRMRPPRDMALGSGTPAEMTQPGFERRLKLVVSDLPRVLEGHALVKQ